MENGAKYQSNFFNTSNGKIHRGRNGLMIHAKRIYQSCLILPESRLVPSVDKPAPLTNYNTKISYKSRSGKKETRPL
jgi:hypothetical protein